jgi:hypothetical protein
LIFLVDSFLWNLGGLTRGSQRERLDSVQNTKLSLWKEGRSSILKREPDGQEKPASKIG